MRGILTLSLETGHGLAITPEVIERLFVQGPMLPALESVGMDGTCWLGHSLVRLASSPKLPRLRELRLNRCANVDNLSALLESSASHRIRSWHLEADDDASPLAERLLSAPYLDRVEKLHLGRRLTDAMLPRLIHGNPPMNLQQLTLAGTVHDVMVAELAWSPRLERLDSLHFTRRDQPIDATPVIELITSPRATQLRSLAIPFPGVGDVVLDVLIRSAVLPNLESLVISDIAPNREWELYASPMRQKLRKLTIQGRRHVTIRPLTRDFRSSVGNCDTLPPNQSHGADPDLPLTR
jgi:hypothetical protein